MEAAVELAQQALVLAGLLSLPLLLISAVVGLAFTGLSALTGLKDESWLHLGRFFAVAVGLFGCGSWLAHNLVSFASRAFGAE